MAEAFVFAAGIVSIVGFASQAGKGTSSLYSFLKDIKNAPRTNAELQIYLDVLKEALREVESRRLLSSSGESDQAKTAYNEFKAAITALESLVDTQKRGQGDGRVRKKWKNIFYGHARERGCRNILR
ncbi:uncharacterized protein BDZ99DRAFT_466427 [Mytilinidion resinicola]|uniref:NACHT-NTPase and P-loop NTPases N-terminal domain-containing protein n=1 Tax=Mytilinidion resinicola TaxID=574789 RepID=A0A6A6YBD0_9PEZI|nr:uncharacterized protein BDZ99DRAFT_466427 [Mytilinidion resinicola]KAF2805415.1 hypothetical protein BDZ99DRAFT_466427 [Mytilinidion resinicola]